MAYYLDTSAVVKLVAREPQTRALRSWARGRDGELVASDLVLAASTDTFERAALIDPVVLRSLDAIHLAAALELGDDLDDIVTYDRRLADAASALGMSVVAPS